MKLSFKNILPILLIFTLLILFAGCFITPSDEQPGYTPGTITGIIAAPCCSTSAVEVILTYGKDKVDTTTTNELGEYTFTNVKPGKNYVITALCPDPVVKDVALKVVEGETYDAEITDCVSTALGLVVDFLVEFAELGPEEIVLDPVIADQPDFGSFLKFKKLVEEVCRVSENCGNLTTDKYVQDALCKAAEEVGQIVIPDLDLGCVAGFTPGPGPGPGPGPTPGPCDVNTLPDITDVKLDTISIFNIDPSLVADIHLIVGTPYEFCVTATDPDNILPQDLIYYLTIDGVDYSIGNSNCLTITPEAGDVGTYDDVTVNVYDGCGTKTWGPITVIVDCCPFAEPGITIDISEPLGRQIRGILLPFCLDECATINSVTIHYGGSDPLPDDLVITDFLNDTSLTWSYDDTKISFNKTTGEVCLVGGYETGIAGIYTISVTYTDPCGKTVDGSVDVEFIDCSPCANNVAPIIDTIDDDQVVAGDDFGYDVTVTDPDVPAQTLTYSIAVTSGSSTNAPSITKDVDDDKKAHIDWTSADPADKGKTFEFTVTVEDGCLAVDTEVFELEVPDPCADNTAAPYNISLTPLSAIAGQPYTGTVSAIDDDGDTLTFGWAVSFTPPGDMFITSAGVITWTALCCPKSRCEPPTCDFVVDVEVSDGCTTVTQSFKITVTEINAAPEITNVTLTIIKSGSTWTYSGQVSATDDGFITKYELKGGSNPSGLQIDATTGALSGSTGSSPWTNHGSHPDHHDHVHVKVKVTDNGCTPKTDEESFQIFKP